MQFLPVIKQSTDAVINITTGGGLGMTVDERLAAPLLAKPEMCSLNMGSMNFNISARAARVKHFKHDWEKPYLEGTTNYIFRNTFQDIEQIVERLGKGHGTRFEFECYDVGHLYNLAHLLDRGGGAAAVRADDLRHPGRHRRRAAQPDVHAETADRLFGKDYVWSVLAAGRTRCPSAPWPACWAAMCAWGSRIQPLDRQGPAGDLERAAGREDPPHPRGTVARDRHARGGARDAEAQGRRPGRVLMSQQPGRAVWMFT
jgi:uncharacterized protein (DUF849 family)